MTELSLYKFIEANNIEWHKLDNDGIEDIAIFISFWQMEAFNQILSPCLFNNGGIECTLMNGYFAFWMKDICEYYGVELENIFISEGS